MSGSCDQGPPSSQTSIILDSIADGVFTVDRQWRIMAFNRAAEEITGCSRSEAVGRPCCEVFRASICESECALRRTMTTGRPIVGKAVYIVDAEGQRVPISVSAALLRNERGEVVGVLAAADDVPVYAHAMALEAKYARMPDGGSRSIGMPEAGEHALRAGGGELHLVAEPERIGVDIVVIGPVPRTNDFEDTGGPFFLDERCTHRGWCWPARRDWWSRSGVRTAGS